MGDYTRTMLDGISDPTADPPSPEGGNGAGSGDGLVVFDGLNSAIIGLCYRFLAGGPEQFICYDYNKCLDILVADMGDEMGTPQERARIAADRVSRMLHGALGNSDGDSVPAFLMPLGDIGGEDGDDDK